MAHAAAGSQLVPKLTGGENSMLIAEGAMMLARTEKTNPQMSAEIRYFENLVIKTPLNTFSFSTPQPLWKFTTQI